ncbi:Clp protease N-terminal domain-containing protein [Streptomyces sp. RKAG293]|uniref:Clp protease N-terminal domain-containing protein n=1 Tax=Streptomyces sp. RKAG293 TaxID=2893403 RepID=UPI0020336CB3|nr:Clp protease N-terminal domain-containing protein [Streptomyces sp. RKAG293]MCM2422117.1 AAA family ATPase [Streptomyces sp. RKAG293]
MFEKFTSRARQVTVLAQEEARMLNHHHIGTEHILLGLIHEGEGVGVKVLESLGISLEAVRQEVEEMIGQGQQRLSDAIPFTPRAKKVLELSLRESLTLNHNYIGTEHILLGLIREEKGVAAQVLANHGAHLDMVRQQVIHALSPRWPTPEPPLQRAPKSSSLTRLLQFGHDLSESARTGSLQPVVGRAQEIERLMQVLARRTRNVPVLIGEPGVGKTAIVSGLARTLASDNAPEMFRGRFVCSLDLGPLLGDAQTRGHFTGLLDELIDEIQATAGLVLFLDNALTPLHTPAGSGEALALFRRVLSLEGVSVIGAATTAAYGRWDPDPDLSRIIQPIVVQEPPPDEVLVILQSVRERLETHHRLAITDQAIAAAAFLAKEHIPAQPLPGSAIDLLDEASAQARVRAPEQRPDLEKFDEQIAAFQSIKEAHIDEQDFEGAAAARDREVEQIRAKAEVVKAWDMRRLVPEVTEAEVVQALAAYSGVQPVGRYEPPTEPGRDRLRTAAEHDPSVWALS